MDLKVIDVLTSVGMNSVTELDNTISKVVLTAEEVLSKKNTSLAILGISVATNMAIDLIPGDWTLANQVIDKLDVADVVEAVDKGADLVFLGSAVSLATTSRGIYKDFSKIDKMNSDELKEFLEKRKKEKFSDNKENIEEVETV